MLQTTYEAVKAVLRADPSIPPLERNQLLSTMRNGPVKPNVESPPNDLRLIRPAQVAQKLACSVRTVHKLAASGALKKRRLPGRVRSSGFLESDVAALIAR